MIVLIHIALQFLSVEYLSLIIAVLELSLYIKKEYDMKKLFNNGGNGVIGVAFVNKIKTDLFEFNA